ncbi:MAG: hypothetical protein IJZ07_00550 [Clostridia bacterium]|nr:hypothetical protein [Clostridia bacterium]
MKKIIAAALSILIAISCCCIDVSAAEKNDDPIVLISGFLCSQLYLEYGTENEEKLWLLEMDRVTGRISDDLPRFLKTLAGAFVGKTDEFGETLGEGAQAIFEKLRFNPDGTSAYNVSHYPNNPAISNIEYMLANGQEENMYEVNFCKYLSGLYNPSEIFMFQYDSRLDAITLAEQLNEFINDIKDYTGSDKVRIFSLSFGGLISSTYLYLYGDSSVSKYITSVPAIGGTDIPDKLLRGNIDFPISDIALFFETVLAGEGDVARWFENAELESINDIISSASDGIMSALKYWGSIWSLCTVDLYDELKKDFLDPVESKELIEKTDKIHYEIMPAIPDVLRKAQSNGIDVAILCSTGSELALGGDLNGDVVLPAYAVSGATCAPLGMRFSDGYAGIKTTCSNPEHNHVSPSMEVDASSAYLPENTWFVDGQYHGQYYYEEYTRSLVTKLLLTNEIKDIYSNPDYPQFEYSKHASRSIHIKFNESGTGYLSSEDSKLIVENLTTDRDIKIFAIDANGIDLTFDIGGIGTLEAGDKAEIPFSGDIPKSGAVAAEITVSYIEIGSLNPLCVTDFDIMIDNGDAEGAAGFVEKGFKSRLENALPAWLYNLVSKPFFRQTVEFIYNTVSVLFD